MKIAVITGDIIDSSMMNPDQRRVLFRLIAQKLDIWDKEFGMQSETYRGDSFQSLVYAPHNALKIALMLKTFIRSIHPYYSAQKQEIEVAHMFQDVKVQNIQFDARIAIGIGEVDLPIERVATSSGIAFTLSGQLLDKIKSKKQALAIASNDEYFEELETESILLDAIISKTSTLQCEVILFKLQGFTEIKIAEELGIVQSAVNQRSNSANWNAIETMIKRFEKMYENNQ